MQLLKQSTAVTVKIGPFLDSTDGDTAETGLTIAQADVLLSKNGGAFAQKNDSTSCTHDTGGMYGCPLDATDTNTLGRLQLFVHESGALAVWHEFMVVTANVYDSLCSTDKLEVDVTQLGGVAQSATDLKDFADEGYDPSTNQVEGVKLVDTTTTNSDMRGTDNAALASTALSNATWTDARAGYLDNLNGHTPQTGDTYAALPANFSDLAITATAGYVTVGTNNDKTGYGLADDAITSAKYDESTAFPIKSADTGATQIARVGADGDTLETLSDQIDGTSTLTAAQVNAEVVDVLWTDTTTEPTSVPAATAATGDKIDWLFTLSRNKVTQTSTVQTLRNDADGANIATASVSDDGTTFTRGEWS